MTLTNRKLMNLMKAIDEWADAYGFSRTTYCFYTMEGKYRNGEKIEDILPGEVVDGYNEYFIFGMAIDGDIYDAIHMTENYYDVANKKFRDLLKKYGLAYDFVDSTHLTTYLIDEDVKEE